MRTTILKSYFYYEKTPQISLNFERENVKVIIWCSNQDAEENKGI